jgi:hypothetical protein
MNVATDLALTSILADEQDDAERSMPASPPAPPQAALHYCLLLLLLPLLAIPAGIRLGSSDFFLHHGASVWVQSNDAVFNMRDRDCDVLIYGDSTAMTGIDPAVVERNTGFKTCNISVTNAVLAVTHNLTLNHYLARNGKPRVLLIQLSPDGFQPESNQWSQTIYPEGLLELLRHGSPAESRHVLLTHPQQAIAFAGYAAGFTMYAGLKDIWKIRSPYTTGSLRHLLLRVRPASLGPPSPIPGPEGLFLGPWFANMRRTTLPSRELCWSTWHPFLRVTKILLPSARN